MAYGTKYRLSFSNHLGEDYYIFFNLKNYAGDFINILGTGSALQITSINNDDDRFSPIISKECKISLFITKDQDISILNFLTEEDDQWNVIIKRGLEEQPIFNGFLIVSDSSQPLQDKPYVLTLRASDGLPLLKNVPLSMADGENFIGLNSIVDYVGHILNYANADVDLKVYCNFRHASMTTVESPLAQLQVDAKTFEQDAATFENCYSVLEKICTDLQLRIFYENGFWHLVSIWQYHKDYGFNYFTYTLTSNVMTKVSEVSNEVLLAKVGKEEVIYAINKDATIYYNLSKKLVKKTFNYDIRKELVCNQAITKGDPLPDLSGSNYYAYELNCWVHQLDATVPGPPDPTKTAYIKVEYDLFNYNKDKYIALPTETGNYRDANLLSTEFDVDAGDFVSVTMDTKAQFDYPTPSDPVTTAFFMFLRGNDGTKWYPAFVPPSSDLVWIENHDNFATKAGIIFTPTNKTAWQSVTGAPVNAIPVDGKIQIVLTNHTRVTQPNESHFKNISIDYTPFIQGSARPLKGDTNTYSQSKKINKTIEETVYISDSPKKIIKGAIFVNDVLATPEWTVADRSDTYRFTQLMALMKYNFNFRQFQKIEGTLKGLSLFNQSQENTPFGFLPLYQFSDIPNQPNTRYILTSMDVNYVTGQWRGVLVEVQINSLETFDSYDFAYIFQ